MFSKLIGFVVQGYGLLMSLAAGGFIFAKLFGIVVGIVQPGGVALGGDRAVDATSINTINTWIHRGWCFGVGFVLLGNAIAIRKHRKRKASQHAKGHVETKKRKFELRRKNQRGRRLGFLASTGIGGLLGALLGGMLGGTFLLFWFSLAYSPFAPQEWASSTSMERRSSHSARREVVTTTDHPVAVIAFGAPLAMGAILGAAVGGTCGVYVEE